ncbi:MAG TPA: helix-turn-helix domain-containing protein [Gaiellaceae bacterium]
MAALRAEFCPYFQEAAELVGRRWCGAIVRSLLDGPLRFSELERSVQSVSARALAQRLRELEQAGVVARIVSPGPPVRVTYELTAKGRELEPVVSELERWAHAWLAPPSHAHAEPSATS